jgi:hypothetical protein
MNLGRQWTFLKSPKDNSETIVALYFVFEWLKIAKKLARIGQGSVFGAFIVGLGERVF